MAYEDPDTQVDDDSEEESPSKLRRQLSKQASEVQRLQAELANRDKALAFTSVGLPSTPMAEFFKENYQGDASEDAIRAAAAELGLIGSPSAETQQQVQAIDQMSDDYAGATPAMPADQEEKMYAEMRQIRPGPRYAEQVEIILQQYGRPTMRDAT